METYVNMNARNTYLYASRKCLDLGDLEKKKADNILCYMFSALV